MSAEKTETIIEIVRRDGRYGSQAYYFIFDALDFTIQRLKKVRRKSVITIGGCPVRR